MNGIFKITYNQHNRDFGLSPSHEDPFLPSQKKHNCPLTNNSVPWDVMYSSGRTNCLNLVPKIFKQINFQSIVKC